MSFNSIITYSPSGLTAPAAAILSMVRSRVCPCAGTESFCGESGEIYGFHLGWSGNHRLLVESLNEGIRAVQLGEVLDLSNPDVFDYLLAAIGKLLKEHAIAYLKWDMNRDLATTGSGQACGK